MTAKRWPVARAAASPGPASPAHLWEQVEQDCLPSPGACYGEHHPRPGQGVLSSSGY